MFVKVFVTIIRLDHLIKYNKGWVTLVQHPKYKNIPSQDYIQ